MFSKNVLLTIINITIIISFAFLFMSEIGTRSHYFAKYLVDVSAGMLFALVLLKE